VAGLPLNDQSPGLKSGPELGFHMERVTGIEPALSAWELARSTPVKSLTRQFWRSGVAVADPSWPWLTAR
jgi:hypothetical protein